MPTFKQLYLVGYNAFCFCLWGYVGFLLLFAPDCGVLSPNGLNTMRLWSLTHPWISAVQTLALMECLHSLLGIVRSPFMTTAMQVLSRLHIIWIIWRLCPPGRETTAFLTTAGAWTAVELIRYPFYAVNSMTTVPYSLKWLRYSAFIILYPIGISSEVKCIWSSLTYLKEHRAMRSYPFAMPNALNFELDLYATYVLILLAYIPGSVHLYSYMVTQRAKALRAKPEDKSL